MYVISSCSYSLQAIIIDVHQISSGIQVLKRQVVFESPTTDDAVAVLRIVGTHTDAKIITHNKKVH